MQKTQPALKYPPWPPILHIHGLKHGDWIKTSRSRYFVMNPDENMLLRYKKKSHYPFNPMQIIPLAEITNVSISNRTWYMNPEYSYIQFTYNCKIQRIGHRNLSTSKKLIFFLTEGIRYSRFLETVDSFVVNVD